MRINLNEPVSQPRWVWLAVNLTATTMALIALLQMRARVAYPAFVEPILMALLLAAVTATFVLLGCVIASRLTAHRN